MEEWVYLFTQEWPVPGQKHQFSFTLPLASLETEHGPEKSTGLGDIALNYRYQLVGNGEARLALAPRLSLFVPTGSERESRGKGGVGFLAGLALSVVLIDRIVAHSNVMATVTPSAKNALGDSAGTKGFLLGQSLIWLARPKFNLLVEAVWERSHTVEGPGTTEREDHVVISPGLRWAFDFNSGLQIVPGIAFPIGVGPSRGDNALLLYLSFEHPFKKRAR